MDKPYVINLPEIDGQQSKLSVIEGSLLPISIKRVYWIYDAQPGAGGGNHAHLSANRIIICSKGQVQIKLENQNGMIYNFTLDRPAKALYFPKLHWITYTLEPDSMLLVLVDTLFQNDTKMEDYANFKFR